MRRPALLVSVLCTMLLAACAGDDPDLSTTTRLPATTTTLSGESTPLAAVTTWLDALAIGRPEAADAVVVEEQFVLVLAVESFSLELYEELALRGVGSEISATFWESFAAGVRGFTGVDITEVEPVGERRFEAYGHSFAEVAAASPRGDLSVVAVQSDNGRWYVDLLATFGPSFAPLIDPWFDRLPAEADAPREALLRQQASLQVARDRAADPEARRELDALLARVAG